MNDEVLEWYRILEVKPGASPTELKRAYLALVKVWHPDRFNHDPDLQRRAQEKLKEVNVAYESLTKSDANRRESDQSPSTEPGGLQVDRLIHYGGCCDEVTAASSLTNSKWGEMRITRAWVSTMSDFAKKFRSVEYVLGDSTRFAGRRDVITHTEFMQRKIYLNLAALVNLKATLIPLSIIFIRDLLNGVPRGHVKMTSMALNVAGWNGKARFEGKNYLMSELVLADNVSEYFLDRTLNENSEWSNWWSDFRSKCRVMYGKRASLKEFSALVGWHMKNVPIGGDSSRFG